MRAPWTWMRSPSLPFSLAFSLPLMSHSGLCRCTTRTRLRERPKDLALVRLLSRCNGVYSPCLQLTSFSLVGESLEWVKNEISETEDAITMMEGQIDEVQARIDRAHADLLASTDEKEKDHLRYREKSLLDEKQSLLEMKKTLRNKEKFLRDSLQGKENWNVRSQNIATSSTPHPSLLSILC